MAKQKKVLMHYPRFFLSQAIFSAISWLIFLPLFTIVGKRYVETDILGKIFQSFGKDWSFNQYLLGSGREEKAKLLSYASYFILLIIGLNFLSLLINRYLWKKDRYIENNDFYLHNKWIFILNSLIHIACAFLLTFSFVSILTVILALLFISFNHWCFWLPHQKRRNPYTESFFSWKNEYVRKIVLYSIIVIFVLPFLISRLRNFADSASSGSPNGLAKAFNDILSTNPSLKTIVNALIGSDFSLDFLFWLILIWFSRGIISGRIKEFSNFWLKVNGIQKKVSNFKHYYYYQESWALANGTLINLGEYSYIKNNPNFLNESFLVKNLDIDQFAQQNKKVIKYIEFCSVKIKEPTKINFLNYCLFNEFGSWNDCVRTERLIKVTRK